MKNLQFERLWLLSEKEKKARKVILRPNANAVVGTNHTGKSTVVRSLFAAFGCATRPLGGEWDRDAVISVEFLIQGEKFTILKHGKVYSLFNSKNEVLWVTADAGTLRDHLSELFGFVLTLTASKTNEAKQARPAFFFVPFFVDQDGSWDSGWRTFQQLGEFQSWERPTLDLALGVRPPEYWLASSELVTLKRELEDVLHEQKVLEGAREKLAEHFPRTPWYRDAMTFRRELKQLEEQAGQLATEQDAVRNRVAEAAASRDALLAQLRLVDAALGEHSEDMQYLDQFEVGTEIICPTCGTSHEHSFHERLNLEAEADELRELRGILKARAKVAESQYVAVIRALEDLDAKAKRIETLLDTERGKLRLREVVDRAGADKALAAFESQRDVLDKSVGELSRKIQELETKLAALEDKKRAKEIREYFNSRYSTFAYQLEVPTSLMTRKGEVKTKPQQGGSGGPRAVLAYYFALAHTAAKYSPALIPPLVIDSPHQKAQDEINRPKVTEFIFRNRVPGQQLIVGIEEALPSSIKLTDLDRETRLDVKFGLLNEADYSEAMKVLRPLFEASKAHLRASTDNS